MAALNPARTVSKRIGSLVASSAPKLYGDRIQGVHTTSNKQIWAYDNDYLHAEHMYNLPAMKHRKLKMGLAVFGILFVGSAIPVYAVIFQQKKASTV